MIPTPPPELSYEWLTPIDIAWRREDEINHRNQTSYKYGDNHQRASDNAPDQKEPPQDGTDPQREPHNAPAKNGTTATQRVPPQV